SSIVGIRSPILPLAVVIAAITTAVAGASGPVGEVVTYPAPSGQALSSDFAARVRPPGGEWRDLAVYRVTVDLDTQSTAALVEFDSSGPVEVAITKLSGTMHSARIRPLSYGMAPSISADGRTATFTLPRPLNVSF